MPGLISVHTLTASMSFYTFAVATLFLSAIAAPIEEDAIFARARGIGQGGKGENPPPKPPPKPKPSGR